MIANILRLAHSILIVNLFFIISWGSECPAELALLQMGLTLLRAIVERRVAASRTKFQIVASLLLGYTLFPNSMRVLAWGYFVKTVQVHQSLKAVRQTGLLFRAQAPFKYLAFVFDVLRYGLNEFMFLGIVSLIYRFWCDEAKQPIPAPHVLVYQLVVTSSTIGYGDVTPKSAMQMIFYTYAIPFLCASFVIYINNLLDVFNETFMKEDEQVRAAGEGNPEQKEKQ